MPEPLPDDAQAGEEIEVYRVITDDPAWELADAAENQGTVTLAVEPASIWTTEKPEAMRLYDAAVEAGEAVAAIRLRVPAESIAPDPSSTGAGAVHVHTSGSITIPSEDITFHLAIDKGHDEPVFGGGAETPDFFDEPVKA